jgi:hypothetical protein
MTNIAGETTFKSPEVNHDDTTLKRQTNTIDMYVRSSRLLLFKTACYV